MRLVNLTGEDLTVYDSNNQVIKVLPSSGRVHVQSQYSEISHVDLDGHEVPILAADGESVFHLPAPQPETFYIVSGLVQSIVDRADLVSPCRVVRDDESKRSLGCRAFMTMK